MNQILDSYHSHREARAREERELVGRSLANSLSPFNPGDILLTMEEFLDSDRIRIHIQPKNWPSLGTTVDISRSEALASDLDFVHFRMVEAVTEHFRNLPIIPTESHHILGEN